MRAFRFWLIVMFPFIGLSQDCTLELSGYVNDLQTNLPLDVSNVYLSESIGTYTDSLGYFHFSNLCPGEYHIVVSHIGCESIHAFLKLSFDTVLNLTMDHSIHTLDGVLIKREANPISTQNVNTLSAQSISDNANENLSNMIESIVGVNTLKNGSGISKPVVHGLYGNRLSIVNNGIVQSGQQWGNDHGPEIDPMVANKISVIKGTGVLEYQGSNLGSVILIEPKKIEKEPHLHGRLNYFFETNGLTNGINFQLYQSNPFVAWKINASLKKSGDKKTPTYFLNNSGYQEANLALQLEKSLSNRWKMDLYFSTFNAELGVLRGSHIGNLTDLNDALIREVPFFTEEEFSYEIDAPKQQVHHHLLKTHSGYYIDDSQKIDFTAAFQFNKRKEFDVRRGNREDIPALSLDQFSFFLEGKHQKKINNNIRIKSGIQFKLTDNTNIPETGILPLIPDYLAYETGAYFLSSFKIKKSSLELGVRYDNMVQNVATISRTSPRRIVRYNNTFHNASASGGWTYSFNKNFNFSYNIGIATRNPAINELYSSGLHQGVSGIEEGNVSLEIEKSLKTTLGVYVNTLDIFFLECLLYYQRIDDYIYLKPEDEIRLTIRGAFPVFRYDQTNAEIFGFDISGIYNITKSLQTKLSYSYIKANDLTNELPLINFPSNNLKGSISYEFSKPIELAKMKLENLHLELNNQYVFKQNDILESQDFVSPPEGYNLLGFAASTNIQIKKLRFRLSTKLDNILNTTYRNYLNSQRYFANDLGINATFTLGFKF